ncbi:MAG: hypothetical protein KVP17_001747, partial [Porospora cf. gigantea B]|uniref:uncharacterized protein n=1 Tax=Porospora cf. gigantea B TaxID=2853592 RepID=UPI003571FAD0
MFESKARGHEEQGEMSGAHDDTTDLLAETNEPQGDSIALDGHDEENDRRDIEPDAEQVEHVDTTEALTFVEPEAALTNPDKTDPDVHEEPPAETRVEVLSPLDIAGEVKTEPERGSYEAKPISKEEPDLDYLAESGPTGAVAEPPTDTTTENPTDAIANVTDPGPVEFESVKEPIVEPILEPTTEPAAEPTAEPAAEPTAEPTAAMPTEEPAAMPTEEPAVMLTEELTVKPDEEPDAKLTEVPAKEATAKLTQTPAVKPDEEPAAKLTEKPAEEATAKLNEEPAEAAAARLNEGPPEEATANLNEEPADEATAKLNEGPAEEATAKLNEEPAEEPPAKLNEEPAAKLNEEPAAKLNEEPSEEATLKLAEKPAVKPDEEPDVKLTEKPAVKPDEEPDVKLTENPAVKPDKEPDVKLTDAPTEEPDVKLTEEPAEQPAVQVAAEAVVITESSLEPISDATAEPAVGPAVGESAEDGNHTTELVGEELDVTALTNIERGATAVVMPTTGNQLVCAETEAAHDESLNTAVEPAAELTEPSRATSPELVADLADVGLAATPEGAACDRTTDVTTTLATEVVSEAESTAAVASQAEVDLAEAPEVSEQPLNAPVAAPVATLEFAHETSEHLSGRDAGLSPAPLVTFSPTQEPVPEALRSISIGSPPMSRFASNTSLDQGVSVGSADAIIQPNTAAHIAAFVSQHAISSLMLSASDRTERTADIVSDRAHRPGMIVEDPSESDDRSPHSSKELKPRTCKLELFRMHTNANDHPCLRDSNYRPILQHGGFDGFGSFVNLGVTTPFIPEEEDSVDEDPLQFDRVAQFTAFESPDGRVPQPSDSAEAEFSSVDLVAGFDPMLAPEEYYEELVKAGHD